MRSAFVPIVLAFSFCISGQTLQLVQKIPLPGVEGRIDHMCICGDRLYIAAVGNNSLEVLDLKAAKIVQSVKDLPEAQGVRCSPLLNRVFVGTGGDGACRILQDEPLKVITKIDLGDDADNVRIDESAKRVYVGYGDGAIAVIDAIGRTRVRDIKLPGHPESFQLTSDGKRMFVNVPSAKQIAVIDVEHAKVVDTWPVTEAGMNFPMALAEANHRLFTVCRKPAKLIVKDTSNGKTAATLDCCGDADDVFYDDKSKCILITGGDGSIDAIAQKDADHYERAVRIPTASGARTSLWSPENRRLYLAVPHRGEQPAEIRVYQMNEP
jgi:hypothetical protein